MKLVQKLLYKSNGLHYCQEYLCFKKEEFQHPLHVYILDNKNRIHDITDQHCFVGYCPLIFAFPSRLTCNAGTIELLFSPVPLQQNDIFNKKDAIATLILKKLAQGNIGESIVSFYEGLSGKHYFLSGFHQWVIQLNNSLYGKRPGNVFLKGNLYNQVQIGYSVPRKICLITVEENNLFNHFPTDLHGAIDEEHYLISLRHEGKACQQVLSSGRIVLSDMEANAYKKVYSLGKNHMQPLKERSSFDFSLKNSENFHLPLAKDAVAYKELEVVDSFIAGIHRTILFRITYSEKINPEISTLVHIHNCYATWRNKQGIQSNYLMR